MGSLALTKIYDLLELDKMLLAVGMRTEKDDPAPVRSIQGTRVQRTMDLRESVEDEIAAWLDAIRDQEARIPGGVERSDVHTIDEHFNGILAKRSIL